MIRRPPRSTRTDTLFPYTPLFRSVEFARPRLTPAWIIRNLNRRNHVPAMLEPTHHIAAPCLNMEDIEHDPHRRTIDGLSHGISVGHIVDQEHGIVAGIDRL